MPELQERIESTIAELDPAIELIALEQPATETLRLFIDHPQGVDLALCEAVTRQLGALRADYALEVSSPGIDRPLTKLEHFRRFRGSTVRVRTRGPIAGQRSFTGRLTEADERAVTIESGSGTVEIPRSEIQRSNLVPEVNN